MFFLWLFWFISLQAEEQWRVILFENNCEHNIDIVSIINPEPSQLPPNDPVCYSTGTTCKQAGPPGKCPCSAAVIASVSAGTTKAYKETLSWTGSKWMRPSVNYRPEIENVASWSDGAPAEFTFIEDQDWYDVSMIPPGCRSGHYNRFENDYCFGDTGGPDVEGTQTVFNSQNCLSKGNPIAPGFSDNNFPPPSSGYYCAMPDHFTFNGKIIYPCRKVGSNSWFASKQSGSCNELYGDDVTESAFNYIRSDAYHCCYKQAVKLKGASVSPGITASYTIQAMGPGGPISDQCPDRECILDFTKSPNEWVTTNGCQKGYQYPYDDFYSTQTCTPPEIVHNDLNISAKTYKITYCPNSSPPSPPGPSPTPSPGPSSTCEPDVCAQEQCSSAAPWICTAGQAIWGCASSSDTWNNSPSCTDQCDVETCNENNGHLVRLMVKQRKVKI